MFRKIKNILCYLWDLPLAFLITVFELIDYECRHTKKCGYKSWKSFTENLDDTMFLLQDIRNKQEIEENEKRLQRNTKQIPLWK